MIKMEITAYPVRTYVEDNEVFLFDGPNGTKIIAAPDLAKILSKFAYDDTYEEIHKDLYVPAQDGILTTSWNGSGPWTQMVSVPGITSNDRPIVQCNYNPPTENDKKQMIKQWGYIDEVRTIDGGLIFTCKFKKPSIQMPFVVVTIISAPSLKNKSINQQGGN